MSIFLNRFVRLAARKIILSPQARSVAVKAARGAAEEAKLIARDKDKARAAGRSVRRAFGKFQGGGRNES